MKIVRVLRDILNGNWLELNVTGETDDFLDADNFHVIVFGFDLVFDAHGSVLVSNRSHGSILFGGDELSSGFEMLAFSEERVNSGLERL